MTRVFLPIGERTDPTEYGAPSADICALLDEKEFFEDEIRSLEMESCDMDETERAEAGIDISMHNLIDALERVQEELDIRGVCA